MSDAPDNRTTGATNKKLGAWCTCEGAQSFLVPNTPRTNRTLYAVDNTAPTTTNASATFPTAPTLSSAFNNTASAFSFVANPNKGIIPAIDAADNVARIATNGI
ncbi:unannotated protein [freshwater metagenome]|uniref:Unannotated protein n=1 Tax=freshwater metagenome TaxID=449393 RepID=A0A6J6E966_9ZZZZ